MNVEFPLFVFEKDDRSMYLIEKPERLLYHLAAVDIEDGEYVFWDATGAGACVSVTHTVIEQITRCDQPMSLVNAFKAYSESLKLRVSLQGTPIEIWGRIQSQVPKRVPFWTRLFSK
jgi:hypothetical protein